MQKKFAIIILIIIVSFMLTPQSPIAGNEDLIARNEVLSFLESAFYVQVSLTEKDRSLEEINGLLDPYFTQEYKQLFLDANLYEENGLFATFATDFGQYYIPYYRFSDNTNVVVTPNQIYVFEYFPKNVMGPVGYEDHHEGILIKRVGDAWKIADYLYNEIPEEILKQVSKEG